MRVEDLAKQLGFSTGQMIRDLRAAGIERNLVNDALLTEGELMSYYNNRVQPPSSMSEQEQKSFDLMEAVISKSDIIFIDTCSLLLEKSIHFLTNLKKMLAKHDKKLILPYKVYEELQKHQSSKTDVKLVASSNKAIKKLVEFQQESLLEIHGDESIDKFADNVFNTQITRLRIDYSVLLLTNDIGLGQDILSLNRSKSVKGKQVRAYKVDYNGYIQRIREDDEQPRPKPKSPVRPPNTEKKPPAAPGKEQFELAEKTLIYPQTLLPLTTDAGTGSVLKTDTGQSLRLGEEVGRGGEGYIYITNMPGIVAKIYKRDNLKKEKFEKLKLMVSKHLQFEGICYPQNLLFNEQNEFVGYTMPKAEGKELKHFLFIPKKVFEQRNPNWTRKDLVQLSITILEKIQFLHSRNVILGDINPFNILMESPTKIYFVDVDSYQVEGFPCPVGTDNYTAPEIQSKNFGTFLRSFGHDHFAIATLMFSILFLGKSPYSQTGGDTNAENIKSMDFPYSYGNEERAENTPKGQWRYIWSNLPFKMKEVFYQTFQKGEAHTEEHTRFTTEEWIRIMKRYYDDLDSGRLIKQDEIANDIFPSRFKITGDRKKNLEPCRLCNQSYMPWQLNQGICRPCLNKGTDYQCGRCQKELIFTNFEKYIRKMDRGYEFCKDCNSHRRSAYMTIECTSCYMDFPFTHGEKDFYDKKGHNYPKRCKDCRKKVKQQQEQKRLDEQLEKERLQRLYRMRNENKPTEKPADVKKGWCFLTTAACEYYGLQDDCYELETLRAFRDQWLAKQPGGKELITTYYKTAPYLVMSINKRGDRAEIYELIMQDYILPCIQMIETNQMKKCRAHYIQLCEMMVEITKQEAVQ